MKPYRQGQFDALCGLYAVINAALVASKPIKPLRRQDCQDLFIALVDMLVADNLLESAVTEGTTQQTMSRMLKAADTWLSENRGMHLTYRKPFHKATQVPIGTLRKTLAEHLINPKSSAIICLAGVFEHWTTIREIQTKRMILMDSYGRKIINLIGRPSSSTHQEHGHFEYLSTSLYVVNCE